MEEREHVISVLKEARRALLDKDSSKLRELSNQTIHSATCFQDAGYTLTAVIVYALSKMIEREDYLKVKKWDVSIKRFAMYLDLAIKALEEENFSAFEQHLVKARAALISISGSLKHYIEEVLRKAAINKAGKIYEHGLSLERTANLLGITQWELSSYTGGKDSGQVMESMTIKKRAQMALEFFS